MPVVFMPQFYNVSGGIAKNSGIIYNYRVTQGTVLCVTDIEKHYICLITGDTENRPLCREVKSCR